MKKKQYFCDGIFICGTGMSQLEDTTRSFELVSISAAVGVGFPSVV
jgi:hypothetical protein